MATLALTAAGAALGGALLPGGISLLGATITGATIGSQIGSLAGAYVDQALFGATRKVSGPRLSDLTVTTSTEGAPVPRVFGRARLGGQVIWASDLEEEATTSEAGGSAKGLPGGGGASQTSYRYYANFAVGLCEGQISGIGRVWANGEVIDLGQYSWRLHRGGEDQDADSLILARVGAEAAPAYRGTAYVVFERMPLAAFGNRIPQLSFEVFRSVDPFAEAVRAVVMIPGSGEFVYAPEAVTRSLGKVRSETENMHSSKGASDWTVSVDQLEQSLPNARSTSLVVSWFGNDLRAGQCLLRPAVDAAVKATRPLVWSVAGLDRASAPVVSVVDDVPSYGGTPSDNTVIAAIRDLKTRGHKVVLTPFVLMDIPPGNGLEDPYTGVAGQPSYPWRGRITVSPAPGLVGTPDKTSAAAVEIARFVGVASPANFSIVGDAVAYSGPEEWSLRRMILHYAHIALAAGGVDGFVIGSELRGLSQVRSGASDYPFVNELVALAGEVKALFGPATSVTYAADWSEYFGHQPGDGSGDVHFHLDPLWASPGIDAVAIDFYWPLSDWRDGDHIDRLGGARSIYDLAYLKSNLQGGEGYDWYYASASDRDAQVRSPISDGSAGKPWVFRYKDIRSWWENVHHDRPGGVEDASPTEWVPGSKPIWLTEIGCPAIDKGANQPNVFVDPKSSESFAPYYSNGSRDDLMQRRYVQAVLEGFDPAHPGYVEGSNPVSAVYGGRMVDLDHVHLYAWDARPYPEFPSLADVWSDGDNWLLGHWLTGRIADQDLGAVVTALLAGYGFADVDVALLDGLVTGLVLERSMSARDALQPLELAYFMDIVESGNVLRFFHRGSGPVQVTLDLDDLVETKVGADLVRLSRAQETDLPAEARISYSGDESAYRQAVARSRRLVGGAGRVSEAQLALVMDAAQAGRVADSWLFETWAARESAQFTLPPSQLALEPGDKVVIDHAGRSKTLRISEVGERGAREISAIGVDAAVYGGGSGTPRPVPDRSRDTSGPVLGMLLDLPMLVESAPAEAGYAIAAREPWSSGGAAFYRSPEEANFTLAAVAARRGTTGVLLDRLEPGCEGRIDHAGGVRVRLDSGLLVSTTRLNLLAGANAAAVEAANGEWEVLQFEKALLVGQQTYELTTLLRGQLGTESATLAPIEAGARFVLLDEALVRLPLSLADLGLPLFWRYGPAQRAIGDASYTTTNHVFLGTGLRPYSPVHVRGRRTGGDVEISWKRRTRFGGDSWEAVEVPLGEAVEAYEVDILAGTTVVRTLVTSAPTANYPAADQIADFGAAQSAISVRVYQLSSVLGRGTARVALV